MVIQRSNALSNLNENATVRLEDGLNQASIIEIDTIDLGLQIVTPGSKQRLENYQPHPSKRPKVPPLTKSCVDLDKYPPKVPKKAVLSLAERQFETFLEEATKNASYL